MKQFLIALLAAAALAVSPLWARHNDFITVTDYGVVADGKTDVSDAIQSVIDRHPNRTIYFPDGKYLISKSICTPADPRKSVDLRLSDYAMIIASPDWDSPEAMIRLGGKDPYNDININGSNYSFTGGIIEGNVEREHKRTVIGISIDSGRETAIRDVSMKRVKIGIRIKHGANYGSSDADVRDVNIVGTNTRDSIGVLIEGADNTFTNMRIADVYTGVDARSAGNCLYNIHPLYVGSYRGWTQAYDSSVGFRIRSRNNHLIYCYSDHFSTGFEFTDTDASNCNMRDCYVFWYDYKEGTHHTAIRARGKFNTSVTNFTPSFNKAAPINNILIEGESGGCGVIRDLRVDTRFVTNQSEEAYEKYLAGTVTGYN